MSLAKVFVINQNIVSINNNKDIHLLAQNFVDVALKTGWSIGKSKTHDLVLKMAVLDLKNDFVFVNFSNSYPIIGVSQV